MRYITYLILIIQSVVVYAQKVTYVVFEDRPLFNDYDASPFKLRYTDVCLQSNEDKHKSLHIFNLYYSRNNFEPRSIDKERLKKGVLDYRKFYNDVLITLTPLTDSLDNKLLKLTNKQLKDAEYVMPEQLLQSAISHLYQEIDKVNEFDSANTDGELKTMRYKLLIKRGGYYYAFNGPVLTEFYIVNSSSYLFPNQYHYAEINTAANNETSYFSRKALADLEKSFITKGQDRAVIKENIYGRVFPSHTRIVDSLYFIEYNTFQKRSGGVYFAWRKEKIYSGAEGIGTFNFSPGIGIVNGSYDFYFKNYKNAFEAENDTDLSVGLMRFHPVSINHLAIKDYVKSYKKIHPPKIITKA